MFKDNSTHRRVPKPVKGLFFLALAALFLFVLGQVIMFLWNNILAEVTGVKTLNFWQAIGLFVLARILFGGFSRRRWPPEVAGETIEMAEETFRMEGKMDEYERGGTRRNEAAVERSLQ